jgi:hypothetical protein
MSYWTCLLRPGMPREWPLMRCHTAKEMAVSLSNQNLHPTPVAVAIQITHLVVRTSQRRQPKDDLKPHASLQSCPQRRWILEAMRIIRRGGAFPCLLSYMIVRPALARPSCLP